MDRQNDSRWPRDRADSVRPRLDGGREVQSRTLRRRLPRGSGHGGGPKFILLLPIVLLFAVLGVAGLGGAAVISAFTAELPPVQELSSHFAFNTTQILDRDGRLLYEVNDIEGGRRLPVELRDVSQLLIEATIATEDEDFYFNPGIDIVGIARAAVENVREGSTVQGGSTITQQLAKNLLIEESERAEKSYSRKLREMVLALRISQRYSKDDILQMYLNEVYYGQQSYGIEAASQTYFGKSARELNLAESSLLAGLPQAPSAYDPLVNPRAARERQSQVLGRMVEAGYITSGEAERAAKETLSFQRNQQEPFEAPHFVMHVRQLMEQRYGAGEVYRRGFKVTTSLDLEMNRLAQRSIEGQMDRLREQNANNSSLVAMDPKTGEILAMVGSRDYFDESIDGQVNVATSRRQPGSTIKPLEYALAFEKGWGPQTIILDARTDFPPTSSGPPYRPENFDHKFDGPMTVRHALALSKNIPAVKTLMYVTVPEFVAFAARLGIQVESPEEYGLTLALGAAPVSLLDMVGAYAALDNYGMYHPPVALLKVEDWDGNLVDEYRPSGGEQTIGEDQAYMVTSILSDNRARTPLQGPNSPLRLSRPAAAKTGSTDDYRDSWTIGYTPGLVAGVWVGNTDNSPMNEVVGSLGAGRIWNSFMEEALAGAPVDEFTPPPGVQEYRLCESTGQPATPDCEVVVTEVWPRDYEPAQFADVPGLPQFGEERLRAMGGRVIGRTVSRDGKILPGTVLQPEAVPPAQPTPSGEPSPTPSAQPAETAKPTETAEPEPLSKPGRDDSPRKDDVPGKKEEEQPAPDSGAAPEPSQATPVPTAVPASAEPEPTAAPAPAEQEPTAVPAPAEPAPTPAVPSDNPDAQTQPAG